MTGPEVIAMFRWIDLQHQAAHAEAARIRERGDALDSVDVADRTADDLRALYLASADMAAAAARLQAWNDVRDAIAAGLLAGT